MAILRVMLKMDESHFVKIKHQARETKYSNYKTCSWMFCGRFFIFKNFSKEKQVDIVARLSWCKLNQNTTHVSEKTIKINTTQEQYQCPGE